MSERRRYEYQVVDVFTRERFEGNPLAVFPRAAGIDGETMQRIAQELNLSETVFVLEPTRPDCVAKLRIFTPVRELKFAGHPTIGTSFVLWEEGRVEKEAEYFVLEEGVGTVPIRIDHLERPLFWLTTPKIEFGKVFERAACAQALELEVQDLLEIAPQWVSAGNPAVFVAVKDTEAVDRAWSERAGLRKLLGASATEVMLFVFAPTSEGAYSRMFAPEMGVVEDPATGSATGPLAAYMARHKLCAHERGTQLLSEQGTKMGRRSLLHFRFNEADGESGIEVGGYVTPVVRGAVLEL